MTPIQPASCISVLAQERYQLVEKQQESEAMPFFEQAGDTSAESSARELTGHTDTVCKQYAVS